VDATEHRPGLMLAVAFESVVKLVALVAVGLFAFRWFGKTELNMVGAVSTLFENSPPVGFLSVKPCWPLPRLFVCPVSSMWPLWNVGTWWIYGGRAGCFGAYLLVVSVMVLPIAAAGVSLFGVGGQGVAPDSFVLALPLSQTRLAWP